jgi:hypothetical protein
MALNAAEKNELRKLKAECLSDEGTPLDEAPTQSLQRIEVLEAKAAKPAKSKAGKVKRHTLSDMGQDLVDDGAKYLGCRRRGKGVDEYFYRPGESLPQEAIVVEDGSNQVVCGQKFSEKALASLSK